MFFPTNSVLMTPFPLPSLNLLVKVMILKNANYLDKSNCFICAIRSILLLSSFQILAARVNCFHCGPDSGWRLQKPNSFLKILLLISTITFLTTETVTIFFRFCKPNLQLHDVVVLILIVLTNVAVTVLFFYLESNGKDIVMHLQGIMCIQENRHEYGVDYFVDKKFHANIRRLILRYFVPSIATIGLILSLLNYQVFSVELILDTVSVVVTMLINTSNILLVIFYMEIYRNLFDRCYANIRSTLKARIVKKHQYRTSLRQQFFAKRFKKLQVLQLTVYSNFNLLLKKANNPLLVWWLCFVMLFVGNIFLYIINIQEDRPLSNREIVSVIFCALGSLACIFAIYKYQQLHDLVSKGSIASIVVLF
jgi:hypothetical protein